MGAGRLGERDVLALVQLLQQTRLKLECGLIGRLCWQRLIIRANGHRGWIGRGTGNEPDEQIGDFLANKLGVIEFVQIL